MAVSPTEAEKLTQAGQKLEQALKKACDSSSSRSMARSAQNNIGDNNIILNNPIINYNNSHESANAEGQHVSSEKSLCTTVEKCVGEEAEIKVKICKILEGSGQKHRKKVQFRGSFIIADDSAYCTLKVFGPHEKDVMGLFKKNQDLILRKVKVNPDCINFTSYSLATKCTKTITVPESIRQKYEENEGSNYMTPDEMMKTETIGKMKAYVEKVNPPEERPQKRGRKRQKTGNQKIQMRSLTVQENKDSPTSFTLMLFGKIARDSYEEGKSYIFSKVSYKKKYENLATVENCTATRCCDG